MTIYVFDLILDISNWYKWDDEYDNDLPTRVPIKSPTNYQNTPQNNNKQRKQWEEALRRAGKLLGKPYFRDEEGCKRFLRAAKKVSPEYQQYAMEEIMAEIMKQAGDR